MTTGARLVQLSGLPSGTAMAHLMAIQVGAGAPQILTRWALVTEQFNSLVVVSPSAEVEEVFDETTDLFRLTYDLGDVVSAVEDGAFVISESPSGLVFMQQNEAVVYTSSTEFATEENEVLEALTVISSDII